MPVLSSMILRRSPLGQPLKSSAPPGKAIVPLPWTSKVLQSAVIASTPKYSQSASKDKEHYLRICNKPWTRSDRNVAPLSFGLASLTKPVGSLMWVPVKKEAHHTIIAALTVLANRLSTWLPAGLRAVTRRLPSTTVVLGTTVSD